MPSPYFKERNKSFDLLVVFVPPVVGVVSLAAVTYLKLYDYTVVAATFSAILSVLGLTFLGHRHLKAAEKYAEDTKWSVKQHLHATPVGSPSEALAYISSRLSAVKEAKNTSFNTKNIEVIDVKFYKQKSYTDFCNEISKNCAVDLVWTDIGDHYSIDRMRAIKEEVKNQTKETCCRYLYRVIDSACPHMNFVILYYKDGLVEKSGSEGRYAEVYFNWDFRSNEEDPIVYMSTDRELINMYSVHFNTLLEASSPDHDSTEG